MTNPSFESFFTEIYGDRWPALRAAMLVPPRQLTLENPFGLAPYRLDEASALAARALSVGAGDRVLDVCASPGGKALTQVFDLAGGAEWVLNDLSPARAGRLRAILHDCLPPEILARVRVVVGDGARIGQRFAGQFDRVLVDAPCSGERHLLGKASELERWSAKASQRLVVRQHALLCSGFDSVRVGGRVVYSTCTISPRENDGVIAKLTKSRAGQFEVLRDAVAIGEATDCGRMILPDRDGCGPIYYAILARTS